MKDDSKLAGLLRVEWRELLDQKQALEKRMNAIDLLLEGTANEEQAALRAADAIDDSPPKKKRGRRSNAQIAADNAAAEALVSGSKAQQEVAELTDKDEKANEAAQ